MSFEYFDNFCCLSFGVFYVSMASVVQNGQGTQT
jgi:hypothetical protein